MRRRSFLLGALAVAGAGAVRAEGPSLEIPPPVLTIEGERLFSDSAFGRRVTAEIEDAARALASENRRIEAELVAEEKDLTERRAELPPAEFRALADAFDAKVQRLRSEQDAKERKISQMREKSRDAVLSEIAPILSEIVRERGALMILDRRDVFLSADSIDITDEAIRRVNEAFGDGTADE